MVIEDVRINQNLYGFFLNSNFQVTVVFGKVVQITNRKVMLECPSPIEITAGDLALTRVELAELCQKFYDKKMEQTLVEINELPE